MIYVLGFLAILGGIALGITGFILWEAAALKSADDDFHTFSTYWKRAKRRHPVARVLLNLTVAALCVAAVCFAFWLFGHLVLEVW